MDNRKLIYLFAFIGVLVMLNHGCKKDDNKDTDKDKNKVTDIDGNLYDTVVIGDQTWMAQNLKVTHYRNGDLIDTTSPVTRSILGEPKPEYQWVYDGDEENLTYYGRLYNWYTVVDSRNICPAGWHIPSDDEWKKLEMYLGMSQADADGTETRGTNEGSEIAGIMNLWGMNTIVNGLNFGSTGFDAIPGGYRHPDGTFNYMGDHAFWWTSTEFDANSAWFRQLYRGDKTIMRGYYGKTVAYSVRCLKD